MLNLNNEIWKVITRLHEVSNCGNIRNFNTKKLLNPHINTTVYYYITLRNEAGKKRKHYKLHQLIAKAFIPNPLNHLYINHKDGNKLNNNLSNLEWVTHKENMEHASELNLISKKPRTLSKKLGKSSKYFNVGWDSNRNKWAASICVNKQKLEPKRFNSEIDAALHINYLIDKYNLPQSKNII